MQFVPAMEPSYLKLTMGDLLPIVFQKLLSDVRKRQTDRNPCICMYMYVYVCICMYMYVYVCICMYMYVYVCVCMYVCMYVCT